MVRPDSEVESTHSLVRRYGLALLAVTVATVPALVLQSYGFRDAHSRCICLRSAIAAWFGGNRQASAGNRAGRRELRLLFTEPLYSSACSPSEYSPSAVIVSAFAVLIGRISSMRRSVERDLRQTRGRLQVGVPRASRGKRGSAASTSNWNTGPPSSKPNEESRVCFRISHDLRAPLRRMSGYAELLQKRASSVLDERSQQRMKTIQDAARRMGSLIDDLFAFRDSDGRIRTRRWSTSRTREGSAQRGRAGHRRPEHHLDNGRLPAGYGDRSSVEASIDEPALQRHQVHPYTGRKQKSKSAAPNRARRT